MVILIGGIGCSGKTYLANQLMQKTNIPYFPLDHLMMGLYRGLPDCGFTPMDDQFFLGEKMWPVIRGLIMTNIENHHNIILEGFQLLPQLLNDFPTPYLEEILPIYVFLSESYIKENFNSKILNYRSVIENRSDIEDITPDWLIRDTNRLKDACIKSEIEFFEIDDNFEIKMREVQEYIVAQFERKVKKQS